MKQTCDRFADCWDCPESKAAKVGTAEDELTDLLGVTRSEFKGDMRGPSPRPQVNWAGALLRQYALDITQEQLEREIVRSAGESRVPPIKDDYRSTRRQSLKERSFALGA